jgi:hypothetical protein
MRLSQEEATDILALLYDEALLMRANSPHAVGQQTYRLHDLLYDIARRLIIAEEPKGLGLTLRDCHELILQNYATMCKDARWSAVPDDGYIHRHLITHMINGDRPDLVRAVLNEDGPDGRNAWYYVNDRIGFTSGYFDDIESAARFDLKRSLATNNPLKFLPSVVQNTLIRSSVNSIASNTPPELMELKVKSQIWTSAISEALGNVERWWQ